MFQGNKISASLEGSNIRNQAYKEALVDGAFGKNNQLITHLEMAVYMLRS
jgi:hypothetical protein